MLSPDSNTAADRDAALDGVRGLAVGMVLVHHLLVPVAQGPLSAALLSVSRSMFIGVDLFFVLSGFLITSILLRTRERPGYFRSFYWRRALRILPLYALVLVYAFAVVPAWMTPEAAAEQRSHFWVFALFLQNFAGTLADRVQWPGFFHLWSLAIEEQFYALWPLVVLLTPTRRLLPLCAALVLGSIACRFALYAAGTGWNPLYAITPCRVDGLAAGAWVAAWMHLQRERPLPSALNGLGALGALVLLGLVLWPHAGGKLFDRTQVVLHNTAATVAFAWLLFRVVQPRHGSRLRATFSAAPLRRLGIYSYGVYLVHWLVAVPLREPLLAQLTPLLGANGAVLAGGGAMLAITLLIAVALYHGIEAPALSLKSRVPGGMPAPLPRPVEEARG